MKKLKNSKFFQTITKKIIPHLTQKFIYRVLLMAILLWMIPYLNAAGLMKTSTMRVFGTIIIYAIVALGVNLLLGFSGLISLGTAGFMGFGSYLFPYISNNVYDGFFVAFILTVLITALLGAFIGLLSLRIEGIYLAIGTLFMGEILLKIFKQVEWFSGAFSPERFHYPTFHFFGTTLVLGREQTFWLLVVFLTIIMLLFYNLIHSRTGRGLMAMSRSSHAAQAMGVSLLKYRMIAFISATVLASIGGILYISYFKSNYPTNWDLELSLFIIAMVVVGGYKSIFGTLLGAFVIHGVPNLFLKDIFSEIPQLNYVFNGVLIIVVIMFYPHGLIQLWYDFKKLMRYLIKNIKKILRIGEVLENE